MRRPRRRLLVLLVEAAALVCGLAAVDAGASTLPSGFRDDRFLTDLKEPTAVALRARGQIFVAEKAGRIVVFDGLEDTDQSEFADLRTEVYDNYDRGLLGIALDPGFPARPYVYALYTYDHVLGDPSRRPKWGTAGQSWRRL